MPSQKPRSKEDTWTPGELNRALNKTGERRHHRDKDDNRKRERVISEDKPRRRKEDDSERRHHRDDDDRRRRRREEEAETEVALTEPTVFGEGQSNRSEEERERLRRERREKREGKDGKDRKSKGELQFNTKSAEREIELNDINDDDERRRRHHGDRERRHKDESDRHHKNGESSRDRRHHDKERRHKDDDDDRERRRRHRDDDDEEDEKERRRRERRKEKESREDEDRRRRHEEKKDRRRDEDRDRKKDRDREERSDKHRDRKDKDRDRDRDKDRDRHRDKDERRESERDKEKRREQEREERRRERDERHKEKEENSSKSSRHKEEKEEEKEEEDEYNYEEDFEDYEEDFEEDDDDDDDEGNQVQGSIHKDRRSGTRLEYNDNEVNDVLKALDAENERLIRESTDSPKYKRDSRHHDDDDSDDQYEKAYQPRQDRPKTAINFVSAKQRAISRKTASKTMQRSHDLLKMIERDFVSFDILDMPPVNEYDLYIRAFGGSNTRQAYVQTNDDNIEREIQTEEVDTRQKWTQYPSESLKGCGRGDGDKDFEEEEESQLKHNREEDLGRLNKFLEKAGQVIAILLEEDKEMENEEQGRSKSHINISDSFTQIDFLPILNGRHVVYSHFSPVQPNLLLTAYSAAPEVSSDNPVSKKGIICVWNTNDASYPQKILACSSQPQCCCFSPVKPSLVFAGMVDGSIAMWDLREPSTLHLPTRINQEEYALRYPTYDTAGVLTEENHHSPVCSITPIYSYINRIRNEETMPNFPLPASQQSQASDDSSGLSFQLVSTENSAILHFWVVAEIGAPDLAGSQTDLGLAPGGKVKLLKSSTLTLESPSRDNALRSNVRALDMKLVPSDPNQFYVSTDSGIVIHGVRFGNRAFPRAHAPVIETIVDVVSIDFSPFEQPCFLAGCSDGSFALYHTRSEHPLITWTQVTHGKPIVCVKWSRSRPCVFFILDAASTLYIFDLLEGDIGPKQVETIAKEKVINFALTNDHKATGLGTPGKDAQMLFSMVDGRTEIHTISKSLTEPEQLETDYLASYLQRF